MSEKDCLVDVDEYPAWARTWLLIGANKNFICACGVMFVIFLPNIIWGTAPASSRPASSKRKKVQRRNPITATKYDDLPPATAKYD
eukprot:SAG22_NODE_191_length_15699_cov_19.660192_14_plen_86_part_00